jgi:phosphate transport system substrate-binding protein
MERPRDREDRILTETSEPPNPSGLPPRTAAERLSLSPSTSPEISADFEDKVGTDKSVSFPVGVGGKGNEGATALIKQSPGTVGYVEYGYAKDNGLSMASLQNKSGNFVAPDIASARNTLANVVLPENLRIWPVDPEGANDYPIVGFTWLLLEQKISRRIKTEGTQGIRGLEPYRGPIHIGELGLCAASCSRG